MPARKKKRNVVQKRPTETITGFGAALAVYGFCTQVDLPQLAAAVIAVAVAVVPLFISEIVDGVRRA